MPRCDRTDAAFDESDPMTRDDADNIDSAFEQALGAGLSRLAAQAPAGPTADGVRHALRRRGIARAAAFSGAIATGAAAAIFLVTTMLSHPSAPRPVPQQVNRGESPTPLVASTVHIAVPFVVPAIHGCSRQHVVRSIVPPPLAMGRPPSLSDAGIGSPAVSLSLNF
jgi:hypothetical protein